MDIIYFTYFTNDIVIVDVSIVEFIQKIFTHFEIRYWLGLTCSNFEKESSRKKSAYISIHLFINIVIPPVLFVCDLFILYNQTGLGFRDWRVINKLINRITIVTNWSGLNQSTVHLS